MSLLTIAQNAADEVGVNRPSSVIGSTDATAIRILRYAIRVGRELVKDHCPYLIKEHTFSTSNGTEAYSLPSDFDHFVPFTHWNRTTDRRMHPILPSEWQLLKSGLTTTSINDRFRIRGADRELLLDPTPNGTETVAFEYVSKNYCESVGGTGQSVWTADTDVGVLDEELFELGIIWRLLNRLGMPYAEEKAEYQGMKARIEAQINPIKVSLDGRHPPRSNIPDSDFPSS